MLMRFATAGRPVEEILVDRMLISGADRDIEICRKLQNETPSV